MKQFNNMLLMSQSGRSGSDILVFDISSSDLTENCRIFLSWPQALTSVREPHFAIDLLSAHCSTHYTLYYTITQIQMTQIHNTVSQINTNTQTHVMSMSARCWNALSAGSGTIFNLIILGADLTNDQPVVWPVVRLIAQTIIRQMVGSINQPFVCSWKSIH